MKRIILALAVLSLGSLSCNKSSNSPTSPDIPSIPDTSVITSVSSGSSEPIAPPIDQTKGWIDWSRDGNSVYGQIIANVDGYFGIGCYSGPMNDPGAQKLVGHPETVYLRKGEEAKVSAPLECGVRNQCDFHDLEKPRRNGVYGEHVIAGKLFDGDACPPPPPDKCTPEPEPKCEYGQAVYNSKSCTWSCPEGPRCEEHPDPACPTQQWIDYPECRWVGECCTNETGFEGPSVSCDRSQGLSINGSAIVQGPGSWKLCAVRKSGPSQLELGNQIFCHDGEKCNTTTTDCETKKTLSVSWSDSNSGYSRFNAYVVLYLDGNIVGTANCQ